MSRNTKGQVIEALDGWLKGKERHRIRHIKREEREREKKVVQQSIIGLSSIT
jgi:hypothetical protein